VERTKALELGRSERGEQKATFTSEWAASKSPLATRFRTGRAKEPVAERLPRRFDRLSRRDPWIEWLANIAVNEASVAGRLEAAARPAAAAPAAAEAAESAATTTAAPPPMPPKPPMPPIPPPNPPPGSYQPRRRPVRQSPYARRRSEATHVHEDEDDDEEKEKAHRIDPRWPAARPRRRPDRACARSAATIAAIA
jgi:hypothetical protein